MSSETPTPESNPAAQTPAPAEAPARRQLGCGHYVGMLIILGGLAALLAAQTCTTVVSTVAGRVAKAFDTVFHVQPIIHVDERIISTQTRDIAEIAIVTKEQSVDLEFTQDWRIWNVTMPLTTKKIKVSADYRLKAGFDLGKKFEVWIDEETGKIRAELPRAELLSIERIDDSLRLSNENAWFNSVTTEEREDVLNQLDLSARKAALESGLLQDAEERAEKRLNELLEKNASEEKDFKVNWKSLD